MKVLLTKSKKDYVLLKNEYLKAGIDLISCESIELKPFTIDPCGTRSIRRIANNCPVLITSSFACELWLDLRETYFVNSRPKYYIVVGNKTAEMLKESDPEIPIETIVNSAKELKDYNFTNIEKILYPCSKSRRDEVFEIMLMKKISIIDFPIYSIEKPDNLSQKIENCVLENEINFIVFYSPSAVINFFESISNHSLNQLKDNLTTYVAIGETTKNEINKYISSNVIVAENPSNKAIIEQIQIFKK